MADLTSYIKELQKKGYGLKSIKDNLLKYGYPENEVDKAIYNLNQPEIKHTIHLTKTSLIAIVVVVIGLIITSFIIFSPGEKKEELLDVNIDSIDDSVNAGEFLSASIELSNMGAKSRYDVYIKYDVFDEKTKNRITFKSETVALETTKSHNVRIKIPENAGAGNYRFHVTVRYSGQTAESSAMFRIDGEEQKESCYDSIKNQDEEEVDCGGICKPCKDCPESCDDNDASTRDYCDASTDFECEHEGIARCGDNVCSSNEDENSCPQDCEEEIPVINIWDKLERIKKLAESNPTQAKYECQMISDSYRDKCYKDIGEIINEPAICDKIINEMQSDRCFSSAAEALKKHALCENIVKESRKDSCYINFAIDGDYSVCDKIINPYLQKSCNALKQTAQ